MKRKRLTFTALLTAAAFAAASLLVAAPAQAAEFSNPVISGLPSTIELPASGTKTVNFTVTFSGDAPTNDIYYSPYASDSSSPKVTLLNSNTANPASAPYVYTPTSSSVVPNSALAYSLDLSAYKTPGQYRLDVPITQRVWNGTTYVPTTKSTSATFTVKANTTFTKSWTSWYVSGKFGKKFKGTFRSEDYMKGATVNVYFKASGTKKFKKIASFKLNAKGDKNFTIKKGKIKKKGKMYMTVSNVKYASGFKTKNATIKKLY